MKFTKMHGLGNDYVYIDTEEIEKTEWNQIAKKISNRHLGIGSDGLILIGESKVADFKMRMFNCDGSEAQMCGNGIRCVGKYVYDKHKTEKTNITIETLAGIKQLQLHIKNEKVETVTVNMGKPNFIPNQIPVKTEEPNNLVLEINQKPMEFYCLAMGNPHAITIVEEVDLFPVEVYGPIIEEDSHFPEKTNVEFVQIQDRDHIKMRVWERGAGETLACGTGACASLVACVQKKQTNRQATIQLLGGNLQVQWDKETKDVYMTGPAQTVFEGEIE